MEIRQLIEDEKRDWKNSSIRKLTYSFMLGRMKFWLNHYRSYGFSKTYTARICQMIGAISFNLSLNNEDTQTERS